MENVGHEVFKAVTRNSYIFCDIMQFSPLKLNVSEESIASIFRVEE
jgi:hypothetical protein